MPAGLVRESSVYLLLFTGEWQRNITHENIRDSYKNWFKNWNNSLVFVAR